MDYIYCFKLNPL